MNSPIADAKSTLRAQIRARMQNVSPAVRAVESIGLCDRLEPQMRSAHTILFFAPLPDELDVWPLLKKLVTAGKVAALPYFDAEKKSYGARQVRNPAEDVLPGKFGVREPAAGAPEIPLGRFDLVLVPGVAFDINGNRLGRGRGFYDRLLAQVSGLKCGIGYDFQLMEQILTEPHDATVDFIFTPSRSVRRQKRT